MGRVTALVISGVLLIGVAAILPRESGSQPLDRIMRQKLEQAQVVLGAIVVEDFESVEEAAVALARLTEASGWAVLRSPEYRGHSADFLRACEALAEAAGQRSIDATALEYVNLTLKCVQCHKYVRNARLATGPRHAPRATRHAPRDEATSATVRATDVAPGPEVSPRGIASR